jgi:formylglycine-generating enzyme required for sulfatase activity/serine/threonine protein kinase
VLGKAHTDGVIHRDLKPANLLLKEPISGLESLSTEHLRIADFGLALDKNTEFLSKSSQQAGFTGRFVGTPLYMSPEQADDARKVGPSADIYSLGVILYEMLTGSVPINAPSLGEFISRLKTDMPVPPRRLAARCPRDLEAVCLKCLRKDPKGRYATAEQLAEDLEAVLADNPLVYARPVGWVERVVMWGLRNKLLASSLSTAVLALIAGTIVSTSLYLDLRSKISDLETKTREVADVTSKEAIKRLEAPGTVLQLVPDLAKTVRENDGQTMLNLALEKHEGNINLQLASVLCGDQTRFKMLMNQIQIQDPFNLKVLAEELKGRGIQEFVKLWWNNVRNVTVESDQRLRFYGLLAVCDHENAQWGEKSKEIVDLLMGRDLLDIGDWAELFNPIGKHLVEAFLNVLVNEIQASNKTEDVDRPRLAAEYLHRFTNNNPEERARFAISVPSDLVPWLKRKAIFTSDDDGLKAALRLLSADNKNTDRLRAHAAAQLAMLGEWDPALSKMGFNPDPSERTWLINRLIVLKPEISELLRQYVGNEPKRSISNCGILDVLYEFAPQLKNKEKLNVEWNHLVTMLKKEWRENPHPGVHAGTDRLLRKLNIQLDNNNMIEVVPESGTGNKNSAMNSWSINKHGMTLIRIASGQEFVSGSPENEQGRNENLEFQVARTIDYPFEIGAKEVGKSEFFGLIQEAKYKYRKEWLATDDPSINDVSFYDAARFCNELSNLKGISEDQWCYEIDPATSKAILKPNFIKLHGYRLPTEVEWEFACRAGTVSAYCFGNVQDHLADYANYSWSRKDKMMPRGSYRPNFLGMFDMHGNVMEWAHGSISHAPLPRRTNVSAANDTDGVLRGGPWHNGPAWCRSAARNEGVLTNKGFSTGFRVARTLPSHVGTPK